MKIISLLIRTSLPLFIMATITSVLTGLSSTILIRSVHEAVQNEIANPTSFFTIFVSALVMYGVFALIASYAVANLTQNAIHQLRIRLSKKLLKANFQQMEYDQGKILPVLTTDIATFSYAIDQLPHVLTGVATVLGCYAYLFWLSWKLTLLTLGVFFMFVFPLLKFTMPMLVKYSERARTVWDSLYGYFDGLVNGLKELTLNKKLRTTYVDDLIAPLSKKQNRYQVQEHLAMAFSQKFMDIILLSGIGFLLFLILKFQIVEFSFFGNFLMVILFTMAPLSTASGFLQSLKRSEVALGKINKLGLELEEHEKPKSQALVVENWKDSQPIIELKSVSHQYYHQEEDRHFTLGPIDLTIYDREIIFVVGGNGSGKTTFAKMLTGLYKPKEGKLFYKGVDIDWNLLEDYRDQFAGLYTDFHLFKDLNHIPEETIKAKSKELISLLLLDNKVSIENSKLSTVSLSQGQRKRLALMTSIIEDKEIYLFDEWAANQDPQFKSIFYNQILPDLKSKGKTCIVISHDETYFDQGDRVLEIRDGQLYEREKSQLV